MSTEQKQEPSGVDQIVLHELLKLIQRTKTFKYKPSPEADKILKDIEDLEGRITRTLIVKEPSQNEQKQETNGKYSLHVGGIYSR